MNGPLLYSLNCSTDHSATLAWMLVSVLFNISLILLEPYLVLVVLASCYPRANYKLLGLKLQIFNSQSKIIEHILYFQHSVTAYYLQKMQKKTKKMPKTWTISKKVPRKMQAKANLPRINNSVEQFAQLSWTLQYCYYWEMQLLLNMRLWDIRNCLGDYRESNYE